MSDTPNQPAPSRHEANKLLRVLEGKALKYTVRVHTTDGRCLEFQSDTAPKVKWFDEARCLWLMGGNDYNSFPVMAWPEGGVLLIEENPKP